MKEVNINGDESHLIFSDSDLIKFLADGNVEAFEIIYKKYSSILFSYARKNISVKEDCEEIVQEVFESLWIRRQELRILNLSAYLFSAVRYKVMRYFQQSKVKRKYEEHFKFFEVLYSHSDELQVSPVEASAIIQKCILELPKRYQDVMTMKLYNELSNAEIAQKLQLTPQTVEIYISNAIKGLRTAYQKRYNPLKG